MTTDFAKAPVQEGDVVAGKYRVERPIGSGGMGVVVAARHLQLDEPVALKFVAVDRATDREAVGRMMREARATFRLRSEHTVRVMDVGELPSGPVFIVMELLEGRDLRAELAARGPLPEKEVVQHALETCLALEEAHAAGIVHRDLKPHNLFLARTARGSTMVKVLDFGMSKLDPELFEAGPLTRPETALGTPRYMAPEQWKSADAVDHRADIWALGVVMFELLTGEAPLGKLRGAERQARLLAGAIPAPREVRPEVTEGVSRAVMKCLRADPRVRWPSVAHLATALRDAHPELAAVEERLEVTRTDVTVAVPPAEMQRRADVAFAQQTEAPPRRGAEEAIPVAPPTARETPLARGPGHEPRPDDFDLETEVRPPLFTPEEMQGQTPPSPATPKKPASPKAHAATLRSAGTLPNLPPQIALAPPTDKTIPMPGAPKPKVPAPVPTAPLLPPSGSPPVPPAPLAGPAMQSPGPIAQPLAPSSVPSPAGPVLPPAPARPPAPPRLDTRGIVLIVLGGLLSMLVAAVLAWIVVRSFSP